MEGVFWERAFCSLASELGGAPLCDSGLLSALLCYQQAIHVQMTLFTLFKGSFFLKKDFTRE